MTLREKIADWISGGKYSESKRDAAYLRETLSGKDAALKAALRGWDGEKLKTDSYRMALYRISQMETPKAAHAARKMAAVANEALGKTDKPVKVAP